MYRAKGVPPATTRTPSPDPVGQPRAGPRHPHPPGARHRPRCGGSAAQAGTASFVSFALGALLPLLPWFFLSSTPAVFASVVIGAVAALGSGRHRAASRAGGPDGPPAPTGRRRDGRRVTYGVGAALGSTRMILSGPPWSTRRPAPRSLARRGRRRAGLRAIDRRVAPWLKVYRPRPPWPPPGLVAERVSRHQSPSGDSLSGWLPARLAKRAVVIADHDARPGVARVGSRRWPRRTLGGRRAGRVRGAGGGAGG